MSVTVDGSTYLQRSSALNQIAQIASSQKVTANLWIKRTTSASAEYFIGGKDSVDTVNFAIYLDASDQVNVLGLNAGGSTILQLITSDTIADTSWHHLAISADLSAATAYVYIDREAATLGTETVTDDDIAFSACTTWTIFDDGNSSGVFAGSADDFLLWPGVYRDISSADNLRRFISSDGLTDYANPGPTAGTPKPVGYGSGGTTPTDGTEALIVFNGPFLVNRGTGGSFSLSGTLSSARPVTSARDNTAWLTPGERWFNSDRSGWSYPRSEMRRDDEGRKIGWDEEDWPDRDDYREVEMGPLVFGTETDQEDVI